MKQNKTAALYNGYATPEAANYADLAIQDAATKRFLVDIHPSGRASFDQTLSALKSKFASLTVTAVDKKYKGVGVIEGYISLDDVPALGNMREVRSVNLGLKLEVNHASPITDGSIKPGTTLNVLGTVFDQGVYQHRVDQINKFYNPTRNKTLKVEGVSIGFISDSYGDSTADVNNFDLPGSPSNPVNKQPVVVLQDLPGTNEGRGMVQIGYKMAPKARLGFATANGGEVNFANNIRALAV